MQEQPKNLSCRPMTKWQSHKIVEAEKITKIEENDGDVTITMGDEHDAPVVVTSTISVVDKDITWYAQHRPKIGDYIVIYDDGYMSVSPATAFENGYRKLTTSYPVGHYSFGDAIKALKLGKRVSRTGWNGKGMFLFLLPGGTVPKTAIHDPKLREVIDTEIDGDTFEALPSIRMWTTNSTGRRAVLTGWLASQTDMLSEDWIILD